MSDIYNNISNFGKMIAKIKLYTVIFLSLIVILSVWYFYPENEEDNEKEIKKSMSLNKLIVALAIIATIIIAFYYFKSYMTEKYKPYAAIYGTFSLYDFIRIIF